MPQLLLSYFLYYRSNYYTRSNELISYSVFSVQTTYPPQHSHFCNYHFLSIVQLSDPYTIDSFITALHNYPFSLIEIFLSKII